VTKRRTILQNKRKISKAKHGEGSAPGFLRNPNPKSAILA
jgi:hypothetical protein